jgi:hypothetical protein
VVVMRSGGEGDERRHFAKSALVGPVGAGLEVPWRRRLNAMGEFLCLCSAKTFDKSSDC